MGDGFGGERFAGALRAHEQHAPRERQPVAAGFIAEGHVALLQPTLEAIKATDIGGGGFCGAVLQQLTAGDGLPFFLQHLLEIRQAELAAAG